MTGNGWTGGQYSVFRALLGAYLCVHFAQLLPFGAELFSSEGVLPSAALSPLARAFPNVLALADRPSVVTALLALGVALAALLALGVADRVAAVALWYLWACLLGRNPLIQNPSIPYVGWLLLAHACIGTAPWGSLRARGRADPGGGFAVPPAIHEAAWAVLALGYTYGGATKLASPSWLDGTAVARVLECPLARPTALREALLALPAPLLALATWGTLGLELAFAPLALSRRLRRSLWSALLGLHLGLLAIVDFADLSLGMVLFHLFTFDPAWIRPEASRGPERVFHDGACALCQGFVRFVVAEDARALFRFAPLEGEVFARAVPEARRAELRGSVVVLTDEGTLLVRSAAVLHVLRRLGGLWRAVALVLDRAPRGLLYCAYDAIARGRRRLGPARACPIVPPSLRARFDA